MNGWWHMAQRVGRSRLSRMLRVEVEAMDTHQEREKGKLERGGSTKGDSSWTDKHSQSQRRDMHDSQTKADHNQHAQVNMRHGVGLTEYSSACAFGNESINGGDALKGGEVHGGLFSSSTTQLMTEEGWESDLAPMTDVSMGYTK